MWASAIATDSHRWVAVNAGWTPSSELTVRSLGGMTYGTWGLLSGRGACRGW